jgi:2-(1,2-epoxy-1,2-dihydrophenyl)acetyl-CoA isomerase
MNTYKTIEYAAGDGRATITLSRPEVRNAINPTMEVEVKEALLRANQDADVRVVILTGAGTAFCSGIDLRLHKGRSSAEARAHFESFYWGLHTVHRSLDKPTIAVLNGPAREAGCTMAFMCDMIVGAESASIGFPAIDRWWRYIGQSHQR